MTATHTPAELMHIPRNYFSTLAATIRDLPMKDLDRTIEAIMKAYERRSTVYLFGNGGSAALASHHACDLAKGTIAASRHRLRAISLVDNIPLMTAWANDASYDQVFSQQLRSLITPDDVSFAISCSGNSPNVLNALEYSREVGATTIGLSGFQGGKMRLLCDVCVVVPSDNMQIIEDLHVSITHSVFTAVRKRVAYPEAKAKSATS